jgi:hypothetical protein
MNPKNCLPAELSRRCLMVVWPITTNLLGLAFHGDALFSARLANITTQSGGSSIVKRPESSTSMGKTFPAGSMRRCDPAGRRNPSRSWNVFLFMTTRAGRAILQGTLSQRMRLIVGAQRVESVVRRCRVWGQPHRGQATGLQNHKPSILARFIFVHAHGPIDVHIQRFTCVPP